jgi:hypothetical protein
MFYKGNWWNTPNCYDADHANMTDTTTVGDGIKEITSHIKHNNSKSPVEEYWE